MKKELYKSLIVLLVAAGVAPGIFGGNNRPVQPPSAAVPADKNLEVVVQVKAVKDGMPKEGVTGIDILLYKKGDAQILAHQTKNRKNTGKAMEIPFAFKDPYAGLTDKDEVSMKVYGTIFNGDTPKLVGLKNQKIRKDSQKILLTLDLSPVSN